MYIYIYIYKCIYICVYIYIYVYMHVDLINVCTCSLIRIIVVLRRSLSVAVVSLVVGARIQRTLSL